MTRARLLHAIAILLTAAVFLMSGASVHHQSRAADEAARNVETTDQSGRRIQCSDVAEARAGVLLGYIVPCVIHTIEKSTVRISSEMIDWLRPTIYAFMTLVITLFGVRILQGGGQVHQEGIILIMKIGIVIAVMELVPTSFVPAFYGVMNDGMNIVSSAVGPDTSSVHCDMEKYRNPEAPMIWTQLDCLTAKMFGISVGTPGPGGEARPNMLLGASIIGFLAGFLFSGTFGFILFLTLVGVLWSMLMLIIRTVSAFLNGYLYAALLFIITPIYLPLLLLKQGQQYFDQWWKGILASVLLPVVICAYAMFAMLLYDKMLFDPGDASVGREPALLYKLFDNELVKKMQGMPQPLCDMQRAGNVDQRAADLNLPGEQIYRNNPFFRNFVNPVLTAANNQCGGLMRPSVDMTAGLDTESNREAFTAMFKDAIMLLVLALVIRMGYDNVYVLARRLIGSGGVASTLDVHGPVETKIAAVRQNIKEEVNANFRGRNEQNAEDRGGMGNGAAFIRRLGTLPEAIGRGVTTGLDRDG